MVTDERRAPVNTDADTVIGSFSQQQAARLSGLSVRQLQYWEASDVFHPSVLNTPGVAYGRVYSFQDIVALRTLAHLRRRFPLQKLRELGRWLRAQYDHPWSRLRFYVAGTEIVYADPATGAFVSTQPVRQGALVIELEPIARSAFDALQADIRHREPASVGDINRHRHTVRNAWTIAGTRIPVELVQELLEDGYAAERIVEMYPELSIADIQSAAAYTLVADVSAAG